MGTPENRLVVCASHAPGMARDAERRLGRTFRAGLAEARALAEEFDPELVVMFGVDHVRAYQDIVPAISVVLSATGRGDAGSPSGTYDIPADTARGLAEHLIGSDVDCAVTHETALDHGFGQTFGDLFGSLGARPVIPVYINCAEAPVMRCERAVTIGRLVGEHFAADPRRIMYLATGGLSHAPATLVVGARGMSEEERRRTNIEGEAEAVKAVNPEWDEWFLKQLEGTDDAWVAPMGRTLVADAGVGANEVRSWLAAWAAGGTGLRTVAYEPVLEWITGMGVVASR